MYRRYVHHQNQKMQHVALTVTHLSNPVVDMHCHPNFPFNTTCLISMCYIQSTAEYLSDFFFFFPLPQKKIRDLANYYPHKKQGKLMLSSKSWYTCFFRKTLLKFFFYPYKRNNSCMGFFVVPLFLLCIFVFFLMSTEIFLCIWKKLI